MDATQQTPSRQPDAAADAAAGPVFNFNAERKHKQSRSHKATKPQLLTRDMLDSRRGAVQVFDAHARAIQNDLGGRDRLSTIEVDLIEAFVGASLTMSNMNCKIMLGEEVDMGLHALVAGAMVRLASRLGLSRRARDIVPSLASYLESKAEMEAAE
jgi:hypothetical protein